MAKYITLSSVITRVNHKCPQIETAPQNFLITNLALLGLFTPDQQQKLSLGGKIILERRPSDRICQIHPC